MEYEIVDKCVGRLFDGDADIETILEDAMSELGHTKDSVHYPFAKDILDYLIGEELYPSDYLKEIPKG